MARLSGTRLSGTRLSGTRLSGKSAIVTGAGSCLGRASARLFAAEGARVLAVDLNLFGDGTKRFGQGGIQ